MESASVRAIRELLTAKAIRLLRECDAVAAPKSADGRQTALDIASPYIGQDKTILLFDMPMTHDRQARNASHDAAADALCALLDEGKTVVFLTLGDPTIYSTYWYVHKRVAAAAMQPSWCPACRPSAPRLLPWAAPCARTAKCCTSFRPRTAGRRKGLRSPGSKVLMKTGKSVLEVRELLRQRGELGQRGADRAVGMDGQRLIENLDELEQPSGYFSIILVKEQSE